MKIKAGNTQAYCGERIRITTLAEWENSEQELIGITGKITHPFHSLIVPGETYIAGMYVDEEFWIHGQNPVRINLIEGDQFEIIDHSTAEEYPDYLKEKL